MTDPKSLLDHPVGLAGLAKQGDQPAMTALAVLQISRVFYQTTLGSSLAKVYVTGAKRNFVHFERFLAVCQDMSFSPADYIRLLHQRGVKLAPYSLVWESNLRVFVATLQSIQLHYVCHEDQVRHLRALCTERDTTLELCAGVALGVERVVASLQAHNAGLGWVPAVYLEAGSLPAEFLVTQPEVLDLYDSGSLPERLTERIAVALKAFANPTVNRARVAVSVENMLAQRRAFDV